MKNKPILIALPVAILIIGAVILLSGSTADTEEKRIEAKFTALSTGGNVACFGPDYIYYMDISENLQGSCCSPMSLHRYKEQIDGLRKYTHIDKIPSDPYDIPADIAKKLLDFNRNIKLNPEQQKTYEDAMKMSDEGGPCCCKCWRWYVYEGLAKYLITEYNFDAEHIADVWNLSDGCGGEGHATGMYA